MTAHRPLGDPGRRVPARFPRASPRNTSTVTLLRTIPDRRRDQEIVLRPPRLLTSTFRVAEQSLVRSPLLCYSRGATKRPDAIFDSTTC